MTARAITAVAAADFRDRVRRPAYVVTVVAAIALGYFAAPPDPSTYAMVKVGEFRGVYDSAYLGVVMAVVGALWLSLGGFYTVKNAITKDSVTGVGQLVAASPLRTSAYLLGKFLSNLLILATMAGFLAVTALGMQLLRGESTHIDPIALWLPFLLLCLPALAIAAAAAVLFESIPLLRGGLGNVSWFFGFLCASASWLSVGIDAVQDSMVADLRAQHSDVGRTEISVGLTIEEEPLRSFQWTSGLEVTGGLVASQLGILLAAVLIAVLPALWFNRFDPGRRRVPAAAPAPPEPDPGSSAFAAPTGPRTWAARGHSFRRLVAGELRVLLKGQSRWWWLVLAGLTVAALAMPDPEALGIVLLLAWIWPVLIWSRLATHPYEHGADALLAAAPALRRRLLAEWTAGAAVAALAGAGPLAKLLLTGDGAGIAAWLAGAAFIPALALLLGSLSRSARLFQIVYLALWYAVFNGLAAVDYLGAVRDGDRLLGPSPLLVAAAGAGLLAIALLARELRHARR